MSDVARPFGREPELAEVLRLLNSDEVPAVFVAAAPGMGVTTLLRRLFGTLSATRPVLSLHGTPALTLVNYGVLAVLRGMDSMGALSLNPTPALKVLRAHFRAQRQALGGDAEGLPPVVMVDEADSLDPASSDLFASLVMDGDITLVASYDARRPLAGPLSELWGMGLAEEVALEPLDRERTRAYAQEALGAPLLPGLEWKLWQDSGGSPMLLHLLLSEARRNGGIALRRDVWVATSKEPWSGEGLHAIVEERLASLSLQSHHALNAVALGGTLGRGVLEARFGHEAVQTLLDEGFIRFEDGGRERLRMTNPVYGEVVRSLIPRSLSRAILEDLESLEGEADAPLVLLQRTRWLLDSGLPVSPEHLLKAATLACKHFDAGLAERFLNAVPDAGHRAWKEAVHTRLDFNEGEYGRVRERLAAPWVLADPEAQLRMSLIEAATLIAAGLPPSDIRGQARRIRALAASVDADDAEACRTALLRRAEVLQALAANQEGRLAELEGLIGSLLEATGDDDSPHALIDRTLALSLDAERLTVLGDSEAALRRAGEAFAMRHDESFDVYFLPETVIVTALMVALAAGSPQAALELVALTRIDATGAAMAFGGGTSLITGAIRGLQGEYAASLEPLLAGLENLKLNDPQRLRGFFVAQAYMAAAKTGRSELARELRESYEPGCTFFYGKVMATLLMACGDAELEPEGPGKAAMVETAESMERAGFLGLAAPAWSMLLGLGHPGARDRLDSMLARLTGPWAEAMVRFLEAAQVPDAQQILEAGRSLDVRGHKALARSLYRTAADTARKNGDGVTAHHARQALSTAGDSVGDRGIPEEENGPKLTGREKEIARLARDGHSDETIASLLHLSVRTVGGHLSRAYRKLGVSSRRQLADVFKD
ncbi:LuxR C-terminal-related transcriptional regulator [Arthrobacter sp. RAF14]|uniref:helix-turn-helix transcriptional regulator n=1 Tax=Arthrobacter sp. RAF14 TaxID=3233051 RepID=UPI003F8EB4FC